MKSWVTFFPTLIIFTITIFVTSPISHAEVGFDLQKTKKVITKEINKILEDTGIPSISLSLIRNDAIVWSNAFGYANVKKQDPASSSTIYSTGSTFKFITATAIMQLAEAGRLDIDDPVNKFLSESAIDDLSSEGKPVTFRHLLSHHSGLKGPTEITPLWDRKLPKTLAELASEISAEEAPGIHYKYCNHCYALAGLLIEKISKQSFQDYIVEHILKPLNIKSEGPVVPTPNMVEELALPYTLVNNRSIPEAQFRYDVFPAGDIYLTSAEMASFLVAQLNQGIFQGQEILNPESVAAMQEAQFRSTYGLGTEVIIDGDDKFLRHIGSVPGFTSFYKLDLNSKSGIYIVSNSHRVWDILEAISNLSLKLLNGDDNIEPLVSFARKVFEEIKLSENVLKEYLGVYQFSPTFFVSITQEGTHLYAQATGQKKFELFPYDKDKFFLKVDYAQVKFNIRNEKVIGLTLIQNGESAAVKID
jgi:CubicO group peptidase (beta-lactamase class C family)